MITRQEKIKFIILRTLGNFFLLFSLWGMAMTFGPAFYFEFLYRINIARNIKYIVAYPKSSLADRTLLITPAPSPLLSVNIPPDISVTPTFTPLPTAAEKNSFFGDLTGGNKVKYLTPVSAQFGIIIPKIGANAPIAPNVDAGKPETYLPVLTNSVAHAAGTVFPGVKGNVYLFAHSTDVFWNVGRYNAVFYLLKELGNGDEVDIFYNGVRYVYRVVNKLVVDPSEVNFLTDPLPYEQLTLQTCWPPGTTLKRLIVFARPEKDLLR